MRERIAGGAGSVKSALTKTSMGQNKYWRFAIEVTDALPVSMRGFCFRCPVAVILEAVRHF
jgi:hypothetical protein